MDSSISQLISDNQALLAQLQASLTALPAASYCEQVSALKSGSIGGHVRHILDHYLTVLSGAEQLNYDKRERSVLIESEVSAAINLLAEVQGQLAQLPSKECLIQVQSSTNPDLPSVSVPSSLGRELTFVHSHTTHHMAIIRLLALQLGVELNEDFGKAPSTVKYEHNVQS